MLLAPPPVPLALVVVALSLSAAASDRLSADAAPARPHCAHADSTGGSPGRRIHAVNCLVDAARRESGARRLRADRRLRGSAAAKATAIARCHDFGHEPCGEPWQAGMRRAGYARGRYRVGENLAWTTRDTPRAVVRSWLRSPEHRATLLDPRYRDTALARRSATLPRVGVVEVWVQHFGARA